MKQWKRNVIVASILLLVCGGIYVNWRYEESRAVDLVSTLDTGKILDDAALVIRTENETEQSVAQREAEQEAVPASARDQFARMRLSRQESRDSAVHLLQETISYAGAGEDLSASSGQLDRIVNMALAEASIESLIVSKGYADCVAYMTEEGIDLAVSAPEGLKEEDVAVLTDIILSQTEYELPQIRIIEVK